MMDDFDQPLFAINSKDDALRAIDLIKEQGEGTTASPRDPSAGPSAEDDMAHFYKFSELEQGKKIVKDPATGKFVFSGPPIPFPDVYPMAEVPEGGWQGAGVPGPVATKLAAFDQKYTTMVKQLDQAWESGDSDKLATSVGTMRGLKSLARGLMQIEITPGGKTYGPCFRITE
jgi:hypothetical protein